ncbi:hypothetical protein KKA14_08785, partial [bacterium]|nr:hypothetical protein [bacterium]
MSYQSVLIIHDSKPERELLKQFVAAGSDKITVKDVASESEADQLLSLQSFDIVLSSIIHKRFADLSRKGTHVIILIPEESPEILSKLAGLGLCNYQVFPIRQEVLRDQINTLTRNGVARKYPRFDVPGTKVFFHVGITDIEGKILNISEEGILCELTVEGNYDYLLKDICLTIKFPWKYGNRILKELRCNYLATRKAQKDGFKTTLHLVLLLPKLQGTHLEAFKKTLRKIIKKQHPAVIWSTRRLEVTFLKSTYYFYKIHLFRIFLLASLVIAPVVFLIIYLSEEKPEVVWTNGQIYSRSEDDSIWKKEKEKFLPSDNYIRIADGEPEKRGKPDDKDMSPAPGNHTAVLRYTHHESVLLSKEGTVRRKKQGKEISYQLKGAIHLMLQPRNDK